MKRFLYSAFALVAIAAIAVGTADASGLINGGNIKEHTVTYNKLTLAAQAKLQGDRGDRGAKGDTGARGATGATGPAGVNGTNGTNGAAGDSYLKGAYYSVAHYDVGDTNQGAIATVACSHPTDTAISGGISIDSFSNNTPVSESFPGREDWDGADDISGTADDNTPIPGRLDGWIVRFAGTTPPLAVKIWALCVPGLNVPVITTFTESA